MTLTNDSLLLSLHVYGDESRAVNPDDVIGAWSAKVVSSYSSGLFAVAYRRGNDIIIAYRGSDGLGDVDDVSAAYSGDPFGQIRDAQAFFDDIATLVSTDPAYAGTQIVGLTGHSLGGGLASAIAVRENISAEVFAAVPTAVATWLSLGGNVVHSIPAARHNQGFTLQQVAEYGGVTNHALFGEIANYSISSAPIIGNLDAVFDSVLTDESFDGDRHSQYGAWTNDIPFDVYLDPRERRSEGTKEHGSMPGFSKVAGRKAVGHRE